MTKIAFLFLTINDVNFPHIWNKYFERVDRRKYSIWIHPKNPENVTWKRDRIISTLFPTAWGKITDAYMALMRHAHADLENTRFITVSESCVPIRSFDDLYEATMADNRSWVHFMHVSNYDCVERLRFDQTTNTAMMSAHKHAVHKHAAHGYDKQYYNECRKRYIKHYARSCLIRSHVTRLLELDTEMEFFHQMHVGDEFFLSVLWGNGRRGQIDHSEVRDFAVTHDDWEFVERQKKDIKRRIRELAAASESESESASESASAAIKRLREQLAEVGKSPKTITSVRPDLDNIIRSESYFYRKFSKESDIERYYKYILKQRAKSARTLKM